MAETKRLEGAVLVVVECLTSMAILSSCVAQTSLPATNVPTSRFLPTNTPHPSPTPTGTPAPAITIKNADDQYPEGIFKFDPSFASLGSGTYSMWESDSYDLYYTSLDGTKSGRIGNYFPSGVPEFYQVDSKTHVVGSGSMTTSFTSPQLDFIHS